MSVPHVALNGNPAAQENLTSSRPKSGIPFLAPLLPPELAGPWAWAMFGGPPMLVTAHSGSRVVLLAMPVNKQQAVLTVRNPLTGHLIDLTPAHPIARLIVALPELAAHLQATQAAAAHYEACGGCQDGRACAEAAALWEQERVTRQAAFAKAGCPDAR